MIGAVHKSYCKGVAVHQGYNRAFTIHGTHYLRLIDNVVYKVMGHNIFIEDAIETFNLIKRNLVVDTRRSWSLLNTDQTPASFWITHPQNNFIDNHAAGSDRYGFWFDLQTHAMGPSATRGVCPENNRVGQFIGNFAHSNGRYGLRIFHNMVPRENACRGISASNPAITTYLLNFTGWKNGRNGAIAENVGDIRMKDFKTADNKLAGIEYSLLSVGGLRPRVEDGLIVGRIDTGDGGINGASPHGIIGPRAEGFFITGTKFANFNWNGAGAIGTCSHCFKSSSTDSGGRTVTTSNLVFDESTTRRLKYQVPHRAIMRDLDGSLTNQGPNSWATPY